MYTLTKLLGKSASGMNATGEGDRIDFYDKIKTIQTNLLEDNILKMYSIINATLTNKYEEFTDYVFNPLEEATEKEKSELLKAYADTAEKLINLGGNQEQIFNWLKNNKTLNLEGVDFDEETAGLREYGEDEGEKEKSNSGVDERDKADNNDFKETEHPRDKGGKFSDGSGTSEKADIDKNKSDVSMGKEDKNKDVRKEKNYLTSSIKNLGTEYKGFKGKEAINKLIEEKQGYVPDAFTREDIGGIALIWGDKNVGLEHIIKQRTKQNVNLEEFFSELSDVIERGNMQLNQSTGRFEIIHENKIAVVDILKDEADKIKFLLTAFEMNKTDV